MATGLFNLKQVNQAISQGAWSGYIAPRWVEYLVVAGGGGGGTYYLEAGGGGGGLLTGVASVTAGASYTITVGGGGAVTAKGVNSVFSSITATGGGGAATGNYGGGTSAPTNPLVCNGGSGGGMNGYGGYPAVGFGGNGIVGQGNNGGTGGPTNGYGSGGGGGGAGTVGLNGTPGTAKSGGNGGAGIASAITGTVVTYAGGGGGSNSGDPSAGTGGAGGAGGGGAGNSVQGIGAGGNGATNTGGGGGGANNSASGSLGGSGIVVVRYPGNVQFYTGGTVTYSNGYIVHNFTANGTLAPTTPTVVSEYQISRSLRFNSADSTYLNRTPSASNRKTWTFSAWVKRSALSAGNYPQLMSADGGTYGSKIGYFYDETLFVDVGQGATYTRLTSTAVYRDVSAWYHVVVAQDTTQVTDTNRVKVYINGSQITLSGTYPTQNFDGSINNNSAQNIGRESTAAYYFNGYMTEVNFIDGQALTPTSFGYVNPTTGIWSPAKFVGGYGTNGFYLNFSDNSNTTAATLGKDYSGNGNNWTPNNFFVTAGVTNDSFVDSPTSYGTDTGVGGEVRGNYATMNPLNKGSSQTIVNGNLQTSASSSWGIAPATFGMSSGKWYCEVTQTAGGSYNRVGLTTQSANLNNYIGIDAYGWAYLNDTGNKGTNGATTAYGASWTTNDTVGISFDADAGTLVFYKNGTSQGTAYTGLTSGPYFFTFASYDVTLQANFGQRPFAYTAPSGFKALCTQNLPTPAIGATTATTADKFFAPALYTGNGATQTVTVGFQPDLVWCKSRSNAYWHTLVDSVRGRAYLLSSNSTNAETGPEPSDKELTAFTSNGFSLGPDYNLSINSSGATFVSWNWRASNATAVTNTSGSITSTVSANTTSGFSVVTYTGNEAADQTIGHGLGVTPSMIIVKSRFNTAPWVIYTTTTGANAFLSFDNAGSTTVSGYWGTPSSTTFGIKGGGWANNPNGTVVAYCFAPIAGYSAFSSYAGNSSSDGPFVYTGFRPRFIMIKITTASIGASGGWHMHDTSRSPYNVSGNVLFADQAFSEADIGPTNYVIDIDSNGFKIRDSAPAINRTGDTYIFMAFAETPFKYSLAR